MALVIGKLPETEITSSLWNVDGRRNEEIIIENEKNIIEDKKKTVYQNIFTYIFLNLIKKIYNKNIYTKINYYCS